MERFEPLNGFELSGCAIRRWNIIAFWGQQWDNPDPLDVRPTRVYFYYADEPEEEQWAYREVGETRGIRGCGVRLPEERWVFVADDGVVCVIGGGVDSFEEPITAKPFSFFSNVKQVRSGKAYAVGPRRKVFVRDTADVWRQLSAGLFPMGDDTSLDSAGFSDIDGFGDADLYACGGRDLWRFDGAIWTNIEVPTSENLWRICCASDGLVYLITVGRTVLIGRGDSWTMVENEHTDAKFESIVEFNGKVVVSTESALFEISDGAIQLASLGQIPKISSYSFLAAGDGILVVAGSREAECYDGKTWATIIQS